MGYNPLKKSLLYIFFAIAANIVLVSCMDASAASAGLNLAACDEWAIEIENIYSDDKYSPILKDLENINVFQGIQKQDVAFRMLVNQVDMLSSAHTVLASDGSFVRLTIVFISPDMAKTTILTEMLNYPNAPLSANISTEDFKNSTSNLMEIMINRKEYFFLVILTTSAECNTTTPTDGCRVTLPVGSLIAFDTNDNQMPPQHEDHFLEREIHLLNGWESGFVSYSMGAMNNNVCDEWFLDPQYNTSITLGMPSYLATDPIRELTFWFPYQSLLLAKNKTSFSKSLEPVTIDINNSDKVDVIAPPPPSGINFREESDDYKQRMARFVWYKLFQGLFYETDPSIAIEQVDVQIVTP